MHIEDRNSKDSMSDPAPSVDWLRNTSWTWLFSLFIFSLIFGLLLPGMFVDSDYKQKDMVCGQSTDKIPEPWCKSDPFDIWFQGWMHTTKAAYAIAMFSHLLNFVVAPIFCSFIVGRICNCWPCYGFCQNQTKLWLILLSAQLFEFGFIAFTKSTAHRQRPCFYYGREANTEAATTPNEEFLSFYSGDASVGCGFIAVGLYIFWLYLKQEESLSTSSSSSSSLPYTLTWHTSLKIGLPIGILGAVLRTVADMHWFTDMFTGAIMGSSLSKLWIYIFHAPNFDSKEKPLSEEDLLASPDDIM
jgi:hypothetical protein